MGRHVAQLRPEAAIIHSANTISHSCYQTPPSLFKSIHGLLILAWMALAWIYPHHPLGFSKRRSLTIELDSRYTLSFLLGILLLSLYNSGTSLNITCRGLLACFLGPPRCLAWLWSNANFYLAAVDGSGTRRKPAREWERRERQCGSDDEVDDWDERTKEMALSRYVSGYSYCLETSVRVNKKEKNTNWRRNFGFSGVFWGRLGHSVIL